MTYIFLQYIFAIYSRSILATSCLFEFKIVIVVINFVYNDSLCRRLFQISTSYRTIVCGAKLYREIRIIRFTLALPI